MSLAVNSDSLAPVAMFVYDRLDNTRKTIEHLQRNSLATSTLLYIFSDGGKDDASWKKVHAVRTYLRTIEGFKQVHLVEREVNYYLERNIMEGIASILKEYSKIIVLEDDICTSPFFLKYMNDALDTYENSKKVMHISAFTNLDIKGKGDTYFTPHMSGWGWGTWRDRWDLFTHYKSRVEALEGLTQADIQRIQYGGAFQCLKSLDKSPIPWDICWELAIYKNKGLCLSPTHTLVRNIGLYSGTHFSHYRILGTFSYDRPFNTREIQLTQQTVQEDPEIEAMYPEAFKDHGMKYTLLGKIIRYFYVKYIKKAQ